MNLFTKMIPVCVLVSLIACSEDKELDYTNSEIVYESGEYADYDDSFNETGDSYAEIIENPFVNVSEEDISTFSIDADGAAYSNVRRFLQSDNQLPPANAIRTEELINYFDLDYEYTDTSHPINLNGEVSDCPWNEANKLIRIGIKGKPVIESINSNFVFLIDTSGSMSNEDKLELLKGGFISFVDDMTDNDRIAIVTYAGSANVVLESTSGSDKTKIKAAISSLGSGGGTAGAEGIVTAYEIAQENFIVGGNNRIIVGTDGDFNIGLSSTDQIVELIEEKRDSGVYLTALGVGRGNLNDATLEQMANNGNGTYEYIDSIEQLRKVFIYESSKFIAVAKDVKVQVEFNEEIIEAYRLIGYENRVLATEDFEDDEKDAGEIGADQNITALYEIVPVENANIDAISAFKIDVRYKESDSETSVPMELEIYDEGNTFDQSSDFMKFTSSVASFSLILRDSEYKGTSNYDAILSWLEATNLSDEHNFKSEFKTLVEKAQSLD